MSFDGRAKFADDNMDNIRATVNDPLGDNKWWMEFDDPFQGLATCHEIVRAIDSGDPENYMCSLPVHMDGSCNGLQHYAALGRDKAGGKAVNLCIAESPQDVYSGVMHEVIRRVALDAEQQLPFNEDKKDLSNAEKDLLKKVRSARLVNGLIDRGVVKRTVMTSVYGVTYIGAKNQIGEKIEEKLEERGYDIVEIESEIHTACGYLASLTMEVMGQQFTGARQTMNWLTACARLISAQGQPVAFVSPIGVPVVQPYRQKRSATVVTLLQNVVMTYDSDLLPLHRQRQVSAFPPNFVHSLDSSHMILTAVEMKKRGLTFSSVHDSYWTHPCDIEEMNTVLRECFIDLYNQPLLEDLKRRWELRYPSITFPDLPECGDLNLDDVRSAPYFFQ
jgi:DNA-directed RNA polymerase